LNIHLRPERRVTTMANTQMRNEARASFKGLVGRRLRRCGDRKVFAWFEYKPAPGTPGIQDTQRIGGDDGGKRTQNRARISSTDPRTIEGFRRT
jgi:hypothetical protein